MENMKKKADVTRYCPRCEEDIEPKCWITDSQKCNVCKEPWGPILKKKDEIKKVVKNG